MAQPDRVAEIQALESQMAQLQAQIDALSAPPSAATTATPYGSPSASSGGSTGGELWRAEEALRQAEALQVAQVVEKVSDEPGGAPTMADDAGALKAKKAQVDQAKAAVKAAKDHAKGLEKQIDSTNKRYWSLIDQERTASGNPLTEEERVAMESDLAYKAANVREANADADVAEAKARAVAAEEAAAADPANAMLQAEADTAKLALTQAQTASQYAGIHSQQLRDGLAAQAQAIENALAPLKLRSASAQATSDEIQAILDGANAKYAEPLAKANADLQEANVTWQQYQNEISRIKRDYDAELLNGGMPQLDIDTAWADLESKEIANKQLDEGEVVTQLTQWRDAIAKGQMTEAQGDELAETLFSGATQHQRQQQVDANTQTAIQQAATGGYLVGPNQKTTDSFGLLGPALNDIGINGTPQPIDSLNVPEWLGATGQMNTADARKTFAPGGQFYGDNGLPAWADASQGLDIGPEDWAKMQGEQAIQQAEVFKEEQAVVAAAKPAEPAPGTAVTNPVINITLGGGAPSEVQSQAGPPPGLAPPPVAPPGGYDAGGGLTRPSGPPPTIPTPPNPLVPDVVPPAVGPKKNPGPLAPTGPEPWGKPTGSQGMQKFGPQPPPLQVPKWVRSAQFAGGR